MSALAVDPSKQTLDTWRQAHMSKVSFRHTARHTDKDQSRLSRVRDENPVLVVRVVHAFRPPLSLCLLFLLLLLFLLFLLLFLILLFLILLFLPLMSPSLPLSALAPGGGRFLIILFHRSTGPGRARGREQE